MRPASNAVKIAAIAALVLLALLPLLAKASPYSIVLGTDVLIAVIFATSLHFIMGPGGMHSFGHAAYFGLGAYGAALLVKFAAMPMLGAIVLAPFVALAGALLFGWFAVRLSGVYLAMLTLAFAQIVWSIVFQWENVTGGSNGVVGIWPTAPFNTYGTYYLLTLFFAVVSILLLRRMLFAPFGYAMRAGRDSPLRAEAIGIDVKRVHWIGFAIAGGDLRHRGRPVRLRQGLDLAGNHFGRPLHRRSGHGAARRHPDAERADCRRHRLHAAAGHHHAAGRILARAARRHHPAAGSGIPRRPDGLVRQIRRRMEAAPMSVLVVDKLCKSFGGVHAVDHVSFTIGPGEFLALIGPNGAGKSTCFNMINGQLRPDSGKILFGDQDVTRLTPRQIWRLGVGRTFQIAATFGSMTVAENVQMALLSHAGEIFAMWGAATRRHRERALELLAQVGMAEAADRPCSELAYGDVKRVELAIALANDPRLLLMDEPTAGMAPRERNELIALVKRLVETRQMSVLFTEHSMDVVFAFADRIIVLARGKLIADGNAATIRQNPQVQEVYFGTGKTFERATPALP